MFMQYKKANSRSCEKLLVVKPRVRKGRPILCSILRVVLAKNMNRKYVYTEKNFLRQDQGFVTHSLSGKPWICYCSYYSILNWWIIHSFQNCEAQYKKLGDQKGVQHTMCKYTTVTRGVRIWHYILWFDPEHWDSLSCFSDFVFRIRLITCRLDFSLKRKKIPVFKPQAY